MRGSGNVASMSSAVDAVTCGASFFAAPLQLYHPQLDWHNNTNVPRGLDSASNTLNSQAFKAMEDRAAGPPPPRKPKPIQTSIQAKWEQSKINNDKG